MKQLGREKSLVSYSLGDPTINQEIKDTYSPKIQHKTLLGKESLVEDREITKPHSTMVLWTTKGLICCPVDLPLLFSCAPPETIAHGMNICQDTVRNAKDACYISWNALDDGFHKHLLARRGKKFLFLDMELI